MVKLLFKFNFLGINSVDFFLVHSLEFLSHFSLAFFNDIVEGRLSIIIHFKGVFIMDIADVMIVVITVCMFLLEINNIMESTNLLGLKSLC